MTPVKCLLYLMFIKTVVFANPSAFVTITRWIFGLPNDHLICPRKLESCKHDRYGYRALKSLFRRMDADGNGLLTTQEVASAYRIEKSEIDARHQPLTGILGIRKADVRIPLYGEVENNDPRKPKSLEQLWNTWIQMDKYKWNSHELVKMIKRESNGTMYRKIFTTRPLSGRELTRLADYNDDFLQTLTGLSHEGVIRGFRRLIVKNLFFGDIDPPRVGILYWLTFYPRISLLGYFLDTYNVYTRCSFWCTLIALVTIILDADFAKKLREEFKKMTQWSSIMQLADQMSKID